MEGHAPVPGDSPCPGLRGATMDGKPESSPARLSDGLNQQRIGTAAPVTESLCVPNPAIWEWSGHQPFLPLPLRGVSRQHLNR